MTTLMCEIFYGFVFAFMICAAALIATLARKGVRKTFDREMYCACFAASGLGAVVSIVAAQRMNGLGAVSWCVATLVGSVGLLLLGVSTGCFAGIFIFMSATKTHSSGGNANN
jgi:hypothetical protein